MINPQKILAVMLLFFCISIHSKNILENEQPQQLLIQLSSNHPESIKQLQEENITMQKQLEKMEKDIELYRMDVRDKTSEMYTNMTILLALISIIMTILGVVVPLILNNKNEKNVEKMLVDATNEAKEAKKQAIEAKRALTDIEVLKKHVSKIENTIKHEAAAAAESAKKSKISELHAQAYAEKESTKAIELYTQIIDLSPKDYLA